MPETTSFKTDLCLTTEYVESNSIDEILNENIKAGDTFTMNYTHTKNYSSEDATCMVTIVSIPHYLEEWWPDEIYIIDCLLKTDKPIYICEGGAFLARPITIHNDTTTVAKGYVSKIIGRRPFW